MGGAHRRAARRDDRDLTALLDELAPVPGPRGRYDAVLAADRNDAEPIAPAQIEDLARRWSAEYPLFGGSPAADPWRARRGRSGGAPAAAAVPPDLPARATVIGTAAGPRAPLEASRALAHPCASAVFNGWQGAATGAFPRTQCVNALVDNMRVDARVPEAGILCPP